MAFQYKMFHNPKARMGIRFLQTGKETAGQLLEMEATYEPQSHEPPPHYHPFQTEDFTLMSGEMTVRMDGMLSVLKAGDALHVPINKVHSMWNHGGQTAVLNWKVQPAMDTDQFLENLAGLANDGKTDETGKPGLLQVALLANKYSRVFRLASPPYFIQKIVFILLTPFAYLLGYRPSYRKYLD